MTEIKIPQIELPQIDIPETPFFIQYKLEGKIPGCNYYHRDLETTRNPSLLLSDHNGTFITCPDGEIPSYTPMRYDPNEIIYVDEKAPKFQRPKSETTNKTNFKTKEEEKIEYVPWPSNGVLVLCKISVVPNDIIESWPPIVPVLIVPKNSISL